MARAWRQVERQRYGEMRRRPTVQRDSREVVRAAVASCPPELMTDDGMLNAILGLCVEASRQPSNVQRLLEEDEARVIAERGL